MTALCYFLAPNYREAVAWWQIDFTAELSHNLEKNVMKVDWLSHLQKNFMKFYHFIENEDLGYLSDLIELGFCSQSDETFLWSS